jgi:hypothetical protein
MAYAALLSVGAQRAQKKRPCRGGTSASGEVLAASTPRSYGAQHGMFFTIWYGVPHATPAA